MISDREIIRKIRDVNGFERYRRRLEGTINTESTGRIGLMMYFLQGGRRHPLQARDAARAGGLTTRIVDDFLDGDGVRPVPDREEFLSRFRRSFREGEAAEADKTVRKIAYRAGAIWGRYYLENSRRTHQDLLQVLKRAFDKVKEEDRSTPQGYERYLEGAGEEVGECMIRTFQPIDDFEVSQEKVEMGRNVAKLGLIADHIVDGDPAPQGRTLQEYYREAAEDVRSHGNPLLTAFTYVNPEYMRPGAKLNMKIRQLISSKTNRLR